MRPIWFDVFIYIPFLVTAGTQSALGEIMFSLTHIHLHIAAVQRSRPNTCCMWINIYHSVLITSLVSCAVDPAVDIKPDILTRKVHWHDPYALSRFPLLQVETKYDSWAADAEELLVFSSDRFLSCWSAPLYSPTSLTFDHRVKPRSTDLVSTTVFITPGEPLPWLTVSGMGPKQSCAASERPAVTPRRVSQPVMTPVSPSHKLVLLVCARDRRERHFLKVSSR